MPFDSYYLLRDADECDQKLSLDVRLRMKDQKFFVEEEGERGGGRGGGGWSCSTCFFSVPPAKRSLFYVSVMVFWNEAKS